ncbi:hypothetical protein CJ193_006055 [Pseudoglutamicibacter albus]|uniref:hypothetical protein n=1 Tax=Pseudoglutamicibacter albus TaxID=98671 RepID=UPI000C761888|nr:hypothetical protein [Pseudoglutamicibacter albus]PKY79682.1 hypothetical protein CYJ35_08780 [Pseudoglutamicibacter albus]WIK83652.1 hypothetical protein CJ193_006055 [Pseudoglutamicibacter albus]
MNGHTPQTPGPQFTGQKQGGTKRATPWIAGISAAIAVIVLVAGIIWITTRGGAENKASQPSPEASSTTTESTEASGSASPSESDSQPSATDSASETPSGSEESGSGESESAAEDPGTGVNVLEGKLPKAGDPAPSNAIDANRTREDKGSLVASIQVPSGNIGCNIYKPAADNDRMGNQIMCTVDSWKTNPPELFSKNAPHHSETDDALVAITQVDRKPYYGSALVGDKCYKKDVCEKGFEGQVLDYGTVVKHGDYVCQSEKVGLTCWNIKTGRTIFMSKEDLRVF